MTDQREWERRNEAYLSAAIHWLRLRLARMAGAAEAEWEAPVLLEPDASVRSRFLRRREEPKALLAPPSPGPSDADLERAEKAMAEAADGEPPPALTILARRFGLSEFEQGILLLCAALELDTRVASLCARAQKDSNRPFPTFALAVALFDDPAWEVLSPESPLRYWRLIEINQSEAMPLTTSPLLPGERILNSIRGLDYLDERLTPLLVPFDGTPDGPLPDSQQKAAATIERAIRRPSGEAPPSPVDLVGRDNLSKQLVAQHAAAALGLKLYRMPVELLPREATAMETLARLWQRESILLPVALFLDAHEHDGEPRGEGAAEASRPLHRFLARSGGVFLVSVREPGQGAGGGSSRTVAIAKPTPKEQQAAWMKGLSALAEADPESPVLAEAGRQSPVLLAGQFDLNASTIEAVVREAGAAEGEVAGLQERLWDACLERTAPRMEQLAERLNPVASWDDLVLPPDETELLRQLSRQVARRITVYDAWGFRKRMNRGLGITALFAGESGTGKTMAAEVVANDLRLHLYRIDLSAVVSKYIGETEKNLRRLFDAAEDGGAILFFDEADALFGKRSEVRDSHDRYANIEINYLLQRMEAYRGLAILATNMKSALDSAFLRRLRFVATFPFPGQVQRREIWARAWPVETPTKGLDLERLARFNLTGGSIANVALNAAFTAVERGTAVTMPLVLDAVRTELRKLERPYSEADLSWNLPPEPDPRDPSLSGSPGQTEVA